MDKYLWSNNSNSALSSKLSSSILIPRRGIAADSANPVKTKLPGEIISSLVLHHYLKKDSFLPKNQERHELDFERNLIPQASDVKEAVGHSQGTSHLLSIGHSNSFSWNKHI